MFSLIIAAACGAASALALQEHIGPGWGVFVGIIVMLAVQVLMGLLFRKKITAITMEIQGSIMEGQARINRKIQQFQQKPGSVKMMQKAVEKEQAQSVRNALEMIKKLEPYKNWSLLLSKQINSMRLQFHYQLKEFDKVDELIPKALYMEPMLVAMKMVRQYKKEDPKLEKTFNKYIKRFKGERGVILYAVYSWMLVKQGKLEAAMKILSAGKEATGNEVLVQNWKNLANGKDKKFSNAGLADEWYALYLEEPKAKVAHQRRKPF
jgi:hypothetical protein